MALDSEERYRLKLKAAMLHYKHHISRTEIAATMQISRVTLNRLLREAEEEGIVRIEVRDIRNLSQALELEERLRQAYALPYAHVVEFVPGALEDTQQRVAQAAAGYFDRTIQDHMRIGISWGEMLRKTIACMRERSLPELRIYSLLGCGGSAKSSLQPNILTQMAVAKLNAKGYPIHAPLVCSSAQICAALRGDAQIQSVLQEAVHIDLAIVGVGFVPDSEGQSGFHYDGDIWRQLRACGAVGDISGTFLDSSGGICQLEFYDRMITVPLHQLRQCTKILGVASGPHKVQPLLAALRGRYLYGLFTDSETALALLEA